MAPKNCSASIPARMLWMWRYPMRLTAFPRIAAAIVRVPRATFTWSQNGWSGWVPPQVWKKIFSISHPTHDPKVDFAVSLLCRRNLTDCGCASPTGNVGVNPICAFGAHWIDQYVERIAGIWRAGFVPSQQDVANLLPHFDAFENNFFLLQCRSPYWVKHELRSWRLDAGLAAVHTIR